MHNDIKFELMTFDSQKLLDKLNTKELVFKLDFSNDSYDKSDVLLSTSFNTENALFRQICFGLGVNIDSDNTGEFTQKIGSLTVSDILYNKLIYVDFSDLYKFNTELKEPFDYNKYKGDNKLLVKDAHNLNVKMYLLFEKGFYISFDNTNQNLKHFVPFDASESMLRDKKISFIEESLGKIVDQRLLLGMDLKNKNIKVRPHKYFAYRGKYLSSGTRINKNSNLVFSSETVIVLPDSSIQRSDLNGISAKKNTEKKEYWDIFLKNPEDYKKDRLSINAFDGEGLIAPEYADQINMQLFGREDGATSFQIRMPYIKGMLHSVNFREFYFQECGFDITKGYIVIDMFGIQRDLSKAKIILTKSMLKNADWLKAYVAKADECKSGKYLKKKYEIKKENGIIKVIENGTAYDPMAFFFDKFEEYNHTLYVLNTNLNIRNDNNLIKLNYQSLNTLNISHKDFITKIENYVKTIKGYEENENKRRRLILGDYETKKSAWKYALSRNIWFLEDKYIKEKINSEIELMKNDIYKGRIRVKGEKRFLSGDLLAFLINILERSLKSPTDAIKKLTKKRMDTGCFYAPSPNLKLEKNSKYGFLRNPHLSRNEDCYLQNLDNNKDIEKKFEIYNKYFCNLSGIVMVAYSSLAPMTLGGADFDGDTIKLIVDVDIVKAMRNKDEFAKRIVEIPNVTENDVLTPERMQYEHVKDTFGNQIGHISNMAIKLGEKMYSNTDIKENKECDLAENTKYTPAHCTILVGLEIDSAKSGLHPNENIVELEKQLKENIPSKEDKNPNSEEFNYIHLLEELEKIKDKIDKSKTKAENKNSEKDYYTICTKNKKLIIPTVNESYSNITNLFPLYFEAMFSDSTMSSIIKKKLKEYGDQKLFNFEEEKASDDVFYMANAIVDTYNEYIREYIIVNYCKKQNSKTNWYAKALCIIKDQYYGCVDFKENNKKLYQAYLLLKNAVAIDEIKEIIKRIKNNWAYVQKNERLDVLKNEILGEEILCRMKEVYKKDIDDSILSVFINFSLEGYKLLYYIAKHIEQELSSLSYFAEKRMIKKSSKKSLVPSEEADEQASNDEEIVSEEKDSVNELDILVNLEDDTHNNADSIKDNNVYINMKQKLVKDISNYYDKAMHENYTYTDFANGLIDIVIHKNIGDKITGRLGWEIYKKSPKLFWEALDGKEGVEKLKNSNMIFEKPEIVYKGWNKNNKENGVNK